MDVLKHACSLFLKRILIVRFLSYIFYSNRAPSAFAMCLLNKTTSIRPRETN